MTLYVDTSRIGLHGIGRYSREVIDRLDLPWTDLGHRLRRPLPLDVVNPRRMTLGSRDVVYAPGFNAGITRARQFLTIHDLIHLEVASEGSTLKTAYYDRIVRPAVLRSRVAFTVSDTSKERIVEWLDDDRVDVVNTGNGVSDEFVATGPRWSVESEYFLYVGNLREHKNTDVMLDAFAMSDGLKLVMVTSDREAALADIAGRRLEDRVTVLAGVDDATLAAIYRSCTALVMPSTSEGYGLPAAEAIATGRPVIFWSGCASVAEIVQKNGIAVSEARDVAEWNAAIERIAGEDFPAVHAVHRPWSEVARIVRHELEERS